MSDFNPGRYGAQVRRPTSPAGVGGTTPVPGIVDLSDVDLSGIADGDILIWDADTSTWIVGPAASGNFETYDGGGNPLVEDHGAAGATETVDAADGNHHRLTLDDDCTITVAPFADGSIVVVVYQDGSGGHGITWSGVEFGGADDQPDSTASSATIYTFLSDDGTVYGFMAGSGGSELEYADDGDLEPVGLVADAGVSTKVTRADHVHEVDRSLSEVTTGAAETIDATVARVHDLTLDDDPTLTLSGAVDGQATWLTLLLRQDAVGSRTVTWPGSVEWPGGVAPTLTTDPYYVDIVRLLTTDGGGTWFGFVDGQDYEQAAPIGGSGGTFPLVWLANNL